MPTDFQEIQLPDNVYLDKNFPVSSRHLIDLKTDFNSMPPEEKNRLLVKLTPEEEVTVQSWIDNTQAKAKSLGIEPEAINIGSIRFIRNTATTPGDVIGGEVDYGHNGITIDLDSEISPTSPKVERTFYHESSHYFSKRRLAAQKDFPVEILVPLRHGFDRSFQAQSGSKTRQWGFWEESLAELYTAYASGMDNATYYFSEVAFMVAFMEDLTKRLGKDDVDDVFKDIYCSNSKGDLSFFKRLLQHYKNNPGFVQSLNNIKKEWVFTNEEDMQLASREGGFEDEYNDLKKQDFVSLGELKIYNARKVRLDS